MQHLDGNALAGPLADVLGFDATTASARCLGCGTVAMLATAIVFMDAMGAVVHCPNCDSVLATLVESSDRTWVSLHGVSALEIPR
jgi:ribosomal protein S27E